MLIVVESVADAVELIKGTGDKITSLNLGGTKPREGTTNYSKTINLTAEEANELAQLQQKGVDVWIQQVPNDEKQEFYKK